MKQYEKWAEQNPYDRTETMKAWRAALEWVLDDLKAAREGFDLGLHDTINKELEAEDETI